MNYITILGWGIPTVLLLIMARYTYKTYNELTYHLIKVEKIAGNLDAVLKKRYDLIPALVEIVKGYTKHESSVFIEVSKLRSQWAASKNVNERIRTANQIESALSKILSIKESYPHLKADRIFQNIQKSIYHTEREILNERKYYNEVIRRYNLRLRLFPRNIIAKIFGFEEKQFFSQQGE